MKILHHFGAMNLVGGTPVGTYIKETQFDPGEVIPMHAHVFGHLSVLCSGWAIVDVDGVETEIRGPKVIEVQAGKRHTVKALTKMTWLCVHATDERDEEKIDEALVSLPA